MMIYKDIVEGIFIERPNRFIAKVLINGILETVHVKNTGRCKEILVEGTKIFLQKSNNPNRKTKYSLISAYKDDMLINIDSQVPNYVVYEAIADNKIREFVDCDILKREQKYKNSRFDLYYEKNNKKGFIEVKGVTLENDGLAMFPDAPTKRGTKHLEELIDATCNGYESNLFLLIQIDDINKFKPNHVTDKLFAKTLLKAKDAGVRILCYNSLVTKDEIIIGSKAKICLETEFN
ncbi:sugar fermentation stimulation protein [Vallitalea longa]|uniref:Sugar fermentation stimulation protein homolog n=1 Tax=Vallitalea longa TaxID=2936439 RepID=A0A9W5YE46_9FIRM|nr:DNA/RNA nuclease SfsA [Vallitalea longa]GKX31842.1 sugar fermentation stimulation protein [Vallitalea longa]